MEIEFPIYYNFFFKKKKTVFICEKEFKTRIEEIFKETLLGPSNFDDFYEDFIEDYPQIPKIRWELSYFAVNPFKSSQNLTLDLFLEFLVLDQNQ